MNKFWPSLTRNENEQFWKREWKHHGRGQPNLPPEEYFRTAITLVKAANLEAAFRDAGINPDGDGLSEGNYTLAIVARNGTTPLYKCLNKSLLMEYDISFYPHMSHDTLPLPRVVIDTSLRRISPFIIEPHFHYSYGLMLLLLLKK